MERLKEDHLLTKAGVGRFVFIHKTVMEFLAARFVVKKLEDPGYLEDIITNKDIENCRPDWEWIYVVLREQLLSDSSQRLRETLLEYRGAPRLMLDKLLQDFLDTDAAAFMDGDSELLADRKALLYRLVNNELVDRWFKKKEIYIAPAAVPETTRGIPVNILQLDVPVASLEDSRHPEDKNFNYYRGELGPSLQGFLGSPNLRHGGEVNCVAVSPDGRYIASGSNDSTIKLWETASGKESRTFKGHEDTIWSVAFSNDGRHIISGSDDSTIKLWETASGKEIRTFKGHNRAINSVAFSNDGRHIISASNDFTIKIWDISSTRCIETITLPWLPLHISPHPVKPRFFAAANANGTVTLFEWGKGKDRQ